MLDGTVGSGERHQTAIMKRAKSAAEFNEEGLQPNQQLEDYMRRRENLSITPFLIDSLTPDLPFDPEWMAKIDENYDGHHKGIIGETTLICGPSFVGKTGLAHWIKNEILDCEIIKVDCLLHSSHSSFITELVNELSKHVNPKRGGSKGRIKNVDELTRKIVMDDQLRLSELDRFIRDKPKQYIFLIRHAEKLVEHKKQVILYNFFEWIKSDIRDKIGLILMTKKLDFINSLEKRVMSRMNAKIVTLFGPRDLEAVKSIVDKRIEFQVKNVLDPDHRKTLLKVKNQVMLKNPELDKLLKSEIDRAPKNIVFYLEAFRLALALSFSGPDEELLTSAKLADLQSHFARGFQQALRHLCPYINHDELFLYNCNFPEYFVMAIVRAMLRDLKPKITFKQIVIRFEGLKQNHGTDKGGAFNFSRKIMERAVKNLQQLRLLRFLKSDLDFENAEITSSMSAEAIESALSLVRNKPEILKMILDE